MIEVCLANYAIHRMGEQGAGYLLAAAFEMTDLVEGRLKGGICMEQETVSEVEERRKRYEELTRLLKKWIAEESPFDAIVSAELEHADDLTMRCREQDETAP